jgi:hypothetical protein
MLNTSVRLSARVRRGSRRISNSLTTSVLRVSVAGMNSLGWVELLRSIRLAETCETFCWAASDSSLKGLDCPEKNQASGKQAKRATSALGFGREINFHPIEKDKYWRTIADMHLLNLSRGRNTPWDLYELDC